jgi:hypothetical protein
MRSTRTLILRGLAQEWSMAPNFWPALFTQSCFPGMDRATHINVWSFNVTLTNQKCCSNCGASFSCGAQAEQQCWCEELPQISPANKDQDCLCPKCLWAVIQEKTAPQSDSQPAEVAASQNSEFQK